MYKVNIKLFYKVGGKPWMNLKRFIELNNIAYYEKFREDKTIIYSPVDYVKSVLECGDKDFSILGIDQHRYTHTASIYVLGLMLYKNIDNLKCSIDQFIDTNVDEMYNEFLYYWFLICFIHDMGYIIVKSVNLDWDIWNTRDKSKITEKVLNKVNELQTTDFGVVPSEIKKNILKYHEYKKTRTDEFVDHGFFSGAYFIDDRQTKFNRKLRNGDLHCIGNGEYIDSITYLKWSKDILNGIQSKVAEIVIGHNVYYQKPRTSDATKYRKLGLHDLITNTPKYTYRQYPLYFLMQLVDTIDFYKYFKSASNYTIDEAYGKIIEDIDFYFEKDSLSMKFVNFNKEIIEMYWKYLLKQRYWLPIKVTKKNQIINICFQE